MPRLLTESLSPKGLRADMSWCLIWKTWGLAGSQHPVGRALKWPNSLLFPQHASVTWRLIQPLPYGSPSGSEIPEFPQRCRVEVAWQS